MKNKILFIFVCLLVLLIGVNKVSATVIYEDNKVTVDEEYIISLFNENSSFSSEDYPYIFCNVFTSSSGRTPVCYAFSQGILDNVSLSSSDSSSYSYLFNQNYGGYVRLSFGASNFTYPSSYAFGIRNEAFILKVYFPSSSDTSYSNFDFPDFDFNNDVNVLRFSWNKESEPDEPVEEEYKIENKIYLPIELEENMCPYILDKDTIRVYDEEPTENSTITYTDYFINSHYISKSGSETFENDVLMCLDKSKFTTAFYYRFDFHEIMIIFISMLTIVYVIFGKIIHSFFIGFRR